MKRRISAALRERVLSQLRAGIPAKQVSQECAIALSTVYWLAASAGMPLRGTRRRLSARLCARIYECALRGERSPHIARVLGVPERTVRAIIARRGRARRPTLEECERVAARLAAGISVQAIAREMALSESAVYRIRRRICGLRNRPVSEEDRAVVRDMSRKGRTVHEIAAAIERSVGAVRCIRSQLGLRTRPCRRLSRQTRCAMAYALGRGASVAEVSAQFGVRPDTVRRLLRHLSSDADRCANCGHRRQRTGCPRCPRDAGATFSREQIAWRCGRVRWLVDHGQPVTQASLASCTTASA